MTDLLARLRDVNPVPRCDAPTIENVWRRLEHEDDAPAHNASRRRQPAPAPRPVVTRALGRVRLRVGHVGLGLAVAVPVLVAALAIVVLGHNHSRRLATATAPARSPDSGARSRSASTGSKLPHATGLRAPDANLALPIVGSSGTRTLASFRGKVVVLNVFASWCEPCRAETAVLQQAQTVIAGQNATVLGVTYHDDAVRASRAFLHKAHITYPVLRDPSGRFSHSLGISGLPATLVIDPRGHIVAAQTGQIGDQWLTRALRHVAGAEHLIPTGLPLRSPPTPPQLAAIADAYPVLARPQRPSDIPPAGALDPFIASQGGLIANSRRALITSQGESLYIVAAHQSICVTSSDNVINSCQPFPFTPTTPADISATICAPNLPATELEVAGLLPPGASDVKARYSNGTTHSVPTANSMIAIYAHLDRPLPKSITWTSPNGPERTRTGIPPDAATSHCAS